MNKKNIKKTNYKKINNKEDIVDKFTKIKYKLIKIRQNKIFPKRETKIYYFTLTLIATLGLTFCILNEISYIYEVLYIFMLLVFWFIV